MSAAQDDAEVWFTCANELGEGSVAHPDRNSLIWCDILQRQLYERAFSGGEARVHDLDAMPSATALVDARHILLVTDVDLRLFDLETGLGRPLMPFLDDQPGLRGNDGRVHPGSGAFWFGSMGKNAETEAGAIWWFRGGELRMLFDRITIPNAICFSPDGTCAYFSDSHKQTVWRVEVDPATGLPTNEPAMFCRFTRGDGAPDGAIVDADGILWIAGWGASALHAWGPDGRQIQKYRLPVSQPTCPAFFGPALNEIVVTSSFEHMSAEARAAEPFAGSVVKLRRNVRGIREPHVKIAA